MKKKSIFRILLMWLLLASALLMTSLKTPQISTQSPNASVESSDIQIRTAGSSWSHALVISDCMNGTDDWNTGASRESSIAVDSKGNIHVVWEDDTDLGPSGDDWEIMYANYTIATGVWSHALVVSDCWNGTNDWNTRNSRYPHIAIDGDDNLHVIWSDDTPLLPQYGGPSGSGQYDIFYANRTASGAEWSHALVISDCWNGTNDWNTGHSSDAKIAVDHNNNLHVVWYETTPMLPLYGGADPKIMYTNRSASGAQWLHAQIVSDCWNGTIDWNDGNSGYPDIAVDSANNIHVVWEDDTSRDEGGTDYDIFYANRTATGAGWSHAQIVSDCMNGTNDWNTDSSYEPNIAIDGDDNLHVVWMDGTDMLPSLGGDDNEIMYASRTPTAEKWSHALVISDCMNGTNDWNKGSSKNQAIAVDSANNVHVVWQDDTDLGPSGIDSEIMYAKKTSAGWSHALVISDCMNGTNNWNTGNSAYPAIATDFRNRPHVVWYDYTDMLPSLGGSGTPNPEIMYAKYTPPAGLPYVAGDDDDDDDDEVDLLVPIVITVVVIGAIGGVALIYVLIKKGIIDVSKLKRE